MIYGRITHTTSTFFRVCISIINIDFGKKITNIFKRRVTRNYQTRTKTQKNRHIIIWPSNRNITPPHPTPPHPIEQERSKWSVPFPIFIYQTTSVCCKTQPEHDGSIECAIQHRTHNDPEQWQRQEKKTTTQKFIAIKLSKEPLTKVTFRIPKQPLRKPLKLKWENQITTHSMFLMLKHITNWTYQQEKINFETRIPCLDSGGINTNNKAIAQGFIS